MTVVNDGLPLDESATDVAGHSVADLPSPASAGVVGHITDPLTEPLPAAATPMIGVPTDALGQAKVNARATAVSPAPMSPAGASVDQPDQVLQPVDPSAGVPAPTHSTVEGRVEGDLFDGTTDGDRRS